MPDPRRLFPLLFLALAAIAGCARHGTAPSGAGHIGYYVDANLGFAIEHPQSWEHRLLPDGPDRGATVRWNLAGKPEEVRLTITSLPPSEVVGGFDRLLELFQDSEPDFTLTNRSPLELEAGVAQKVDGQTPGRTFEVVLVTARSRAFILAFSAPPKDFDADRSAFDDILESFRILH